MLSRVTVAGVDAQNIYVSVTTLPGERGKVLVESAACTVSTFSFKNSKGIVKSC
jgi:hypothetical protein